MHPYKRQNLQKNYVWTQNWMKNTKGYTWSKNGGKKWNSSLKRDIFSDKHLIHLFNVGDANVALGVVFLVHLVQLPRDEEEKEEEAVWNEQKIQELFGVQLYEARQRRPQHQISGKQKQLNNCRIRNKSKKWVWFLTWHGFYGLVRGIQGVDGGRLVLECHPGSISAPVTVD